MNARRQIDSVEFLTIERGDERVNFMEYGVFRDTTGGITNGDVLAISMTAIDKMAREAGIGGMPIPL